MMDTTLLTLVLTLTQVLLAAGCGALISLRPGGRDMFTALYTHMLVAIGCASLMILAHTLAFPGEREVLVFIVAGIGMLGAAIVVAAKASEESVFTAASLWVTAAIAVAIGSGLLFEALAITLLCYGLMRVAGYGQEASKRPEDANSHNQTAK